MIIVGASSGIGKAIAKLCVENEAEVQLISLSEQKLGKQTPVLMIRHG